MIFSSSTPRRESLLPILNLSNRNPPEPDHAILRSTPTGYGSTTVCHFPPDTSKWNKVEHRLFSFISSKWRGEPLRDYETVVRPIAGTTTAKGLRSLIACNLRTSIALHAYDFQSENPGRGKNQSNYLLSEYYAFFGHWFIQVQKASAAPIDLGDGTNTRYGLRMQRVISSFRRGLTQGYRDWNMQRLPVRYQTESHSVYGERIEPWSAAASIASSHA